MKQTCGNCEHKNQEAINHTTGYFLCNNAEIIGQHGTPYVVTDDSGDNCPCWKEKEEEV